VTERSAVLSAGERDHGQTVCGKGGEVLLRLCGGRLAAMKWIFVKIEAAVGSAGTDKWPL